jgi:hypothetical protein
MPFGGLVRGGNIWNTIGMIKEQHHEKGGRGGRHSRVQTYQASCCVTCVACGHVDLDEETKSVAGVRREEASLENLEGKCSTN